MSKKLLSLIIIIAVPFCLSATVFSHINDEQFRSDRIYDAAMGHATMNMRHMSSAFDSNPASLASQKWFVEIPVSAGLYNASDILQSDFVKNTQTLINSSDSTKLVSAMTDLLGNITGSAPFADVNESLRFGLFGFGMSFDFRERISTVGESVGANFVVSLDSKLSAGYAYEFDLGDDYAITAGLMFSARNRTYSGDFGLEIAVGLLTDETRLEDLEIYTGWNYGCDLGIRADFPYDLSLSAVLSSIGSGYDMGPYRIPVHPEFSLGLSWSPSISFFHSHVELDMNDIFSIRSFQDFLISLDAGCYISLWDNVQFMCGLHSGYPSAGLSLELFCFNATIAYYVQDMGTSFGLRGEDTLALEFTLKFE